MHHEDAIAFRSAEGGAVSFLSWKRHKTAFGAAMDASTWLVATAPSSLKALKRRCG